MKRNKQYRLRMSEEEFEDLSKLAKEIGTTKSNLIRSAIEMVKNESRKEEK